MNNLPLINALLNATAAVLLFRGWRFIKRGAIASHQRAMIGALIASALFLTSYVIYHSQVGHTEFTTTGWPRWVYLSILATHVPLAALMVIPILMLVRFAWRGEIAKHKKLARVTLPVWLYVSVTGVIIYIMLYHLYPQ